MNLQVLVDRCSLVALVGWVGWAFGCASIIGVDDYKVAGGGTGTTTGTGATSTTGTTTTTGTGGPSLEQQCVDFVGVACASNTKCAVSTGDIQPSDAAAFDAACRSGVLTEVDCPSVKAIGGSLANCRADYQAASCTTYDPSSGLPLPASCMDLFLK